MRLNKILAILPVATVLFVAAAPAEAQGSIGFGFTKFGRSSALSIGFTAPLHRPRHHVVVDYAPQRCFVPGRYETVCRKVWVPGCVKRVWIEPVYDTCVDRYGNVSRILIRAGYFKDVEVGGHYDTVCSEVWVPGYYR